jgi:general secretion pathway protein L
MEEKVARLMDVAKIRPILVRILLVSGISAAVALAASSLLVIYLNAQRDALTQRIASIRSAADASNGSDAGSLVAAQRRLEERKHAAPSSVMIIETLSKILPDNTYLTELRIDHDKIQLVGMAHDAPSLIGLMEHTGQFTRATFFAPTTRSSPGPGESFHIEAALQPSFSTQP